MKGFFGDLAAALREVFHPQPWDPPEKDETTLQVIAGWISRHRCLISIDELTELRRTVEKGWTSDTAHHLWTVQGGSAGQCGVTSAWLQCQLHDRGIQSWFHEGTVTISGETHGPHCWLEVAGSVIDLTGDQFGLPEVVYGAPEGVVYRGIPVSPPFTRLAVLEANLREGGDE